MSLFCVKRGLGRNIHLKGHPLKKKSIWQNRLIIPRVQQHENEEHRKSDVFRVKL